MRGDFLFSEDLTVIFPIEMTLELFQQGMAKMAAISTHYQNASTN